MILFSLIAVVKKKKKKNGKQELSLRQVIITTFTQFARKHQSMNHQRLSCCLPENPANVDVAITFCMNVCRTQILFSGDCHFIERRGASSCRRPVFDHLRQRQMLRVFEEATHANELHWNPVLREVGFVNWSERVSTQRNCLSQLWPLLYLLLRIR